MKKIIVYMITLCSIQVAIGQEYFTYGILPEDTHYFALTTPDGWIYERFDGSTLYKKPGINEQKAVSTILVSTLSRNDEAYPTFSDFIDHIIDNYKKHHGIQTTDANDILIDEKTTAKCRFYTGESDFRFGEIAFINDGGIVVQFFMLSESKKDLENSIKAFENLVKSYTVGNPLIME